MILTFPFLQSQSSNSCSLTLAESSSKLASTSLTFLLYVARAVVQQNVVGSAARTVVARIVVARTVVARIVVARAFLLQTVVARIVVQQNVVRSAVVARAARIKLGPRWNQN